MQFDPSWIVCQSDVQMESNRFKRSQQGPMKHTEHTHVMKQLAPKTQQICQTMITTYPSEVY